MVVLLQSSFLNDCQEKHTKKTPNSRLAVLLKAGLRVPTDFAIFPPVTVQRPFLDFMNVSARISCHLAKNGFF